MTFYPHIDPASPHFPGDSSPQPPFGLWDAIRSVGLWAVGVPHLALWSCFVTTTARVTDLRGIDRMLKLMSRAIPALAGIRVEVKGRQAINPEGCYVYVVNHVNLFDMFVIYQAIPHYTRALELSEHFSWPLIGPLITAAGQIPVDPANPRATAAGLRRAATMLSRGESLTVLPEAERSLDGSVGQFHSGAFRLAIGAGVPVVPMGIRGGRAISRRGDWRLRPGAEEVLIAAPIPTTGLRLTAARDLADRARQTIVDLLSGRRQPGT